MCMVVVDMITSLYTHNKILTTFEDLSYEIYQELDNLSYLNDELFDYYCNELFYPDNEDEMILEKCTPELLLELRQIVDDNR
jgi:hypothetical protein